MHKKILSVFNSRLKHRHRSYPARGRDKWARMQGEIISTLARDKIHQLMDVGGSERQKKDECWPSHTVHVTTNIYFR
jgi:hypothetical protein